MRALIDKLLGWFDAMHRARLAERERDFYRELAVKRSDELRDCRTQKLALRRQLAGAPPRGIQ